MRKWIIAATALLLVACSAPQTPEVSSPPNPTSETLILDAEGKAPAKTCTMPAETNTRAVRFDPSYYYGTGLSAAQLSDQLTAQWAQNGVNTVYFLAYNPTYGARYQTTYSGNVMEDWGRLDLLGNMLKAASNRNIRVIAWLYDFRHGGAIKQNPGWASLDRAGLPYQAGDDSQFMTLASNSAETWYQGFIKDLLTRYPALSGIDLAEPVVSWWGDAADHSSAMNSAFSAAYPGQAVGSDAWYTFRTGLLTRHLQKTISTVQAMCKTVHVTATLTADASGNLLSSADLARATGFDLNALLGGSVKPNVVNAELIWQQWKDSYGGAVFTPEWTSSAAQQAKHMIAGRSRLVVHVETTPFGSVTPSPDELQNTLAAARSAGIDGLDVYHTQRLDSEQAWGQVSAIYNPLAMQ